ncbi:uncharacterized protein DUF4440 [Brevibacterium sanguinis]|uniref:Uncharacterized protein DUF4440 n=2 Tax=Brevibacterium TaxID=1696 RepID=A0A366IM03_9MICO|nr:MULTISPECIES: nuclear transport factor 2 family protein [Brevibacterium]RBP65432.1 uncharacterized protein DUF4440 [Brevibacterium sanguinis]RBP72066.1 uncharacterized protein DUF4440 [Brevibacterium celere]
MTSIETLEAVERRLSSGDIDCYREVCDPGSVFIMPGMVATLTEAIAGLEQTPPWDEFELSRLRCIELSDTAAALSYHFSGRRGEQTYEADMVSTYARRHGRWTLMIHQQTPSSVS